MHAKLIENHRPKLRAAPTSPSQDMEEPAIHASPIQMQLRRSCYGNLNVGRCKQDISFTNNLFGWCGAHSSLPSCDHKYGRTWDCREHCWCSPRKNTAINLKFIKRWEVPCYIRTQRKSFKDFREALHHNQKAKLQCIIMHSFHLFTFIVFCT